MSIRNARWPRPCVVTEADVEREIAECHRRAAIITKPGDPGGYRGEYDCGDCCSMSHCETHHKDEGTYPFDSNDASLERGASTEIVCASDVLKLLYPDGGDTR